MSWISLAQKLVPLGGTTGATTQPAGAATASAPASTPVKNERDTEDVSLMEFEPVTESSHPVTELDSETTAPVTTKSMPPNSASKRSGPEDDPERHDQEEPPSKKRTVPPSSLPGQIEDEEIANVFQQLSQAPRPLDGHQVCTLLKNAWTSPLNSRLSDKEWQELVEGMLSELDWKGLDAVLHLAKHENLEEIPDSWLPVIYQAASRLVRDPSRISHQNSASPAVNSQTSMSLDSFKTGAFREHPSAFFEIGKEGGLSLGGRGRCWGRLRGYAFCCWVNLKRRAIQEASESGGDEEETVSAGRQLFRFGSSASGARLECYVVENKDNTGFQLTIRSRTGSNSSWTTCECAINVALNRWHFIVVSHARPYLLGKAKIAVFVDGALQKDSLSVPFPTGKEMDECVLGYGLQGWMGAPSLFEGGDVTAPEAANLCERSRIRVEAPHITGGVDDDEVDDEDDELTSGLGYGREDAADQQVDAGELVKELASRAGVGGGGGGASTFFGLSTGSKESESESTGGKKLKKMIFAFDPRAANGDHCPELVIHGTRRGRRDALELVADDMETDMGHSLMDDEQEDDARLIGDCTVRWETTLRRDAIELAGGARALLLAVLDAPSSVLGDALMLLGDALHADGHLRTSFIGVEGFGLIGREIRKRFYREEDELTEPGLEDVSGHESDGVLVQVALHMMRAAPTNTLMEREFFYAGLKELLLDSRMSRNRAYHSLRLISGLAVEKPKWVREAVGVDGLLRFMLRLESHLEAQAELASDVLRPLWANGLPAAQGTPAAPTIASSALNDPENGPTTGEVASCLCFVAEHPSSAASRALLLELTELVRNNNPMVLRALALLGGVSYLLRVGSFAERNVKNATTGVILRDPDPLPCLLGSSMTPPETRAAMIELIGLLLAKRASACIPMDADNPTSTLLIESEPTEHDINVQLGSMLGIMRSTDYIESHEIVLKALLDFLPKPHGLFVWAPLATEAGDVKGMARVADALRRSAPLAKALLNQRGWVNCFLKASLQLGPIGVAARSAIVAVISRAEDGRHLDLLVTNTPTLLWSETVKTLIESAAEDMPQPLLIRALSIARRKDMHLASEEDRNAFCLKCLSVCETLRTNSGQPHWQSAWLWVLQALPETNAVDVAAGCVKMAMSLASKELAKPSGENRKRVRQFLKLVGGASFEGQAGQLRAEACLGIVQTYSLADDNGAMERMIQDHLEKANTVQEAVRRIVEALPTPPALDLTDPTQLAELTTPIDPQVWTASKNVAGASIRLKQELKARTVEDVRDRLAHKVTDKVRDRRFDARWAQLKRQDGVECRALAANSTAWTVDETFCERGPRFRRRLVHLTLADEEQKLSSVVSRNQLFATPGTGKAPRSPRQRDQPQASPRSRRTEEVSTTSTASTAGTKGDDSDWVKIGEEISRRTTVKGHLDLNSEQKNLVGDEEGQARDRAQSDLSVPSLPPPPPKPASAEAKAKKMTIEEWVNRPPMSIRGETEGRWIDARSGERISMAARSFIVRPRGEVPGRLVITNLALYFDPDPPGAAGNYYKTEQNDDETLSSAAITENDEIEVRQRWSLRGIQRVLLRRHRMLESGIEVFMRGDACKSVFLRFEDVSVPKKRCRTVRDRVVRTILGLLSRAARDRSQHPRSNIRSLVEPATAAWRSGAMSNFDYLMELNLLAGRSVHDLCQYPVFPWILADYKSEELDLDDERVYRDLSKPMGALEPARLEQFIERYETFDDPAIPKFMFGSHYSTAAGVVLHFLVRLEPFRSLHVEMHDKRYDVPDRLFTSVPQAFEASSSSQDLGEVKEITPEFYYLPAAFQNRGKLDLGVSQNGISVGDVDLPPWAKRDAHLFIRTMRAALESTTASANLHKWINLVFGFEQRGPQAVKANNVFYYLTYPGAVDLESIDDVNMRRAVELQIAHFGQCPEQLEPSEPWPQRDYVPAKMGHFFVRPRTGVDTGFAVDQEIATLQARVILRKPITSVPAEDSNNDDGGGGGILALREDGNVVQLIRAFGEQDKGDPRSQRSGLRGVKQPCVWSADGNLMIFAGRAAQGTVELTMLDLTRGDGAPSARATLFAHDENVTALAYDDGLLVTGANDGAVRLWRVGRAGALRRPTVWSQPRRFLRGHMIGQPIVCAAADRAMGVVATASSSMGVLVHDTISGSILWRIKEWTNVERLLWDRATGSLFVVFADSSLGVASVDGSILAYRCRTNEEETDEPGGGKVVCFERVAAGIVVIGRPTAVDVVELPTLRVLQTWPLPDVCAITPPEKVSPPFVFDEHIVINLVTASRTVFVLRRSTAPGTQSGFRLLREAPTAVAGVVSGVVSGATRGVSLIGALDNVRKGVEVGKGVASEAWDVFSSAMGKQ